MNQNIEMLENRISSLRSEAKSRNNWGIVQLGFTAMNGANVIYNLADTHQLNSGGTIGLIAGAITLWSTITNFREATQKSHTADALEVAKAQYNAVSVYN